MATPIWQPGTIYPPGSLVQPASTPPPQPDQVTNGGFESGAVSWTLDTGFSIGQFGVGTHFQGTWSLQWDLTGEGRAVNANATEVTPGQTINASCQVQQGASSSGQAGARVEILWYDVSDDFISSSTGNLVDSTSNQNWKQSAVVAVAPAGAAFARFATFAYRLGGGAELWIDNCTWDAVVSTLPSGLVFRAVQAVAGYSGSSEPTWPLVNGQTVVDNEVTWEAVFASRVVWEASPVLVSGSYEPDWPTVPGGEVADGTIRWVAMNWRVTDPKCPQGPIVAIEASKIFNADDDIIAFSATTNPLDWSSEDDAGFIPFGLKTYGRNPVAALGLYRSNLLAFNAEGYQMWQVDEDPANMAYLDASPVPCTFYLSGQPVSNDFAMVTPVGVRSIGIAGASTNLQAGYFGAQIDPLVLVKILAGIAPLSLTWPAAGQFWAIFGAEAFVLTMNGGQKDWSWSRYVFPDEITDWAILGNDLYLRANNLVWVMDSEALEDDMHGVGTGALCQDVWESHIACETISPPTIFDESSSTYTFSSAGQTFEDRLVIYNVTEDIALEIDFPYEITEAPDPGDTLYLFWDDQFGSTEHNFVELTETSGTITVTREDTGFFIWGISTDSSGEGQLMDSGVVQVTCDLVDEGTPFEGRLWWPYLDFGLLGIDKMMEGFDVVADGTFRISIGYNQRNTALATPEYALAGDTLDGSMVPMPLTAPSFQFRITFDGSQAWEWSATNMYCNNQGTG